MGIIRIDWAPARQPPPGWRVVLAAVVAVAGSLAADAILVRFGTTIFPSTRGYPHFRFSDYAKLTDIGVIIACMAWPIVTRISSAPRWLFWRMAIVVTVVLWLPDLVILAAGQPANAVVVLMLQHLAIAIVTYQALVKLAPPGTERDR